MTPEDPSHHAQSRSRAQTFSVEGAFPRIGPLTVVLIGISVAVAVFSNLGKNENVVGLLRITNQVFEEDSLPEILHGQVWRLVTPIFIHLGYAHIIFNMLAMKDLGFAIESVSGTTTLLALTLTTAVVSNLGQYLFAGPFFGGMSGVVYGLLGYVWMKSRYDRSSGYALSQQTVYMMLGWFVLCVLGFIPHVANYAHGFGLLTGMVWGYIAANFRRSRV